MELRTCPNCSSVYADVQDACPLCEADPEGRGGRLELDTTTRAAVARLGGLFGGILEAGEGLHVLWCAHGTCAVSDEAGLLWRRDARARVENVSVEEDLVRVEAGGDHQRLRLADGEPADRS